MERMIRMLESMKNTDLDAYKKVIEFCNSRRSATEGIPAIIGLDDLTDSTRPVYEVSPEEEQLSLEMAKDALLFTYLYSQVPDRDPHYPDIAPAMSAVAEMDCMLGEDGKPISYRDMLNK